MWEESCLPKYLTKIFLGAVVFLILAVIGTILLNSFLFLSKKKIEEQTWHDSSHQVVVDDIFYVFPNRIVLKNVVVTERINPSVSRRPKTIFLSTKLILTFALWEALARHQLLIRDVAFGEVHLQYRASLDFLQKNAKEILRLLSQLPLNDIRFQAKNIFTNSGLNPKRPEPITVDFKLALKGKNVTAQGSVGRRDQPTGRLHMQFHGKIESSGLFFDNLVFERYDFYSKLWGNFRAGYLQFNGFSLLDTLAQADNPVVKPSQNQRLKGIVNRLKGSPPAVRRLDPNVYILDLGCRAKVGFPQTEIEAFVFSFNTMPVSLKGKVSWEDPVSLDLAGSVLPSPSIGKEQEAFHRADLILSAVLAKDQAMTNGSVKMDFQDLPQDSMPFTKIEIGLQDNAVSFDPQSRLKLHWKQGELAYVIGGNEHRIPLKDSTVLISFLNPLKLISVQSPFYDGKLDGKVWLDYSKVPLKVNGICVLDDVEANKLEGILDYFSKIYGRVFSQFYFTNDPSFALTGKIAIQNGTLNEFDFFKWLADHFALESLRTVPFREAAADFVVDLEKSGLYDIDLTSQDVKLRGFFAVDWDKLVSSKLSLVFSRDLLETSPKFKPILHRFENDIFFGFDFQLSGPQPAMNFQWLDSELKAKIQDWIPNFIERKIERNIDKGLEQPQPVPANAQ